MTSARAAQRPGTCHVRAAPARPACDHASMAEDVHDFTLSVPEATLVDLRERLRRGRLPEAETVNVPGTGLDWSQGAPLSYVRELAGYWADQYDWRRLESELNRHGQSI